MSKIIEVEVYRKNNAATSTTLKLPATPFEIADAFDKLHVTDTKSIYQIEILSCKPDYLSPHLSENINLYDLNHLAQRLNAMSDWELDCFEGMVQMDTEKAKSTPISPERLINLTHSTADCQIAFEAHNDRQLGKFYMEGGMSDIPNDLPQSVYELLDYEAIGKKARIAEGGVFTVKGYVVLSGEVSQDYHESNAVPQDKPSHAIMLEVCKDFFDDDNHSEYLTLPANDGMISHMLGQLNAASVEECSFRAADCIVPKLTELISDSLYESEGDCCGAVNELAKQLKKLDDGGKLITYKAMVEAAPDDLTLEEAIDLAGQAEDFSLRREMTAPPDYAKAVLAKCDISLRDELLAGADLWHYGKKLMEQDLAMITGYGILCVSDGMTVEQCLKRQEDSMSQTMA